MTNNILDLNTINLTPNISSIKKDNHVDLNNYSFEECKEKIKESYIKQIDEEEVKLKAGSNVIFWTFSATIDFAAMFMIPIILCLTFSISLFSSYITSFLFVIFFIISMIMAVISNNKNTLNYKEVFKSKFIKDIDYFLPLSKDKLLIILKNNSGLKEYVRKNNNIIYSQYEIDKVLGTYSNNDFFEEGNEITAYFLNVSNIEFMNIKDTINNEQKEAIFSDYDCNIDNQYKVVYSIENGPEKEVIFNYTHCDKELFKKHICNMVESEYGRECEILSIKLNK